MDKPEIPQPVLSRRDFLKGTLGVSVSMLWLTNGVAMPTNHPLTNAAEPPTYWHLDKSLRQAGNNLLATLDPEDHNLPYWMIGCQPDYHAELQRWWPAHNLGRWWDAMLRLEEAVGFVIPKTIEAAMVENTHRFFDNPDHICLNPDPGPHWIGSTEMCLIWDLHSLREGLLALHGLAKWRKSDWAASMGRKMIESLEAKLREDGTWDQEAFDACRKRGKAVIHNLDPCDTHGRLIEALIWFFEATGEPAALRFAHRLASFHLANTTMPDGTINPKAHADHTHSYLGTLRGLLLYGAFTRQHEYVERVAKTYSVTVSTVVRPSGYTSHNMVAESFGETTSPGDAVQLALWLGELGYPEFLDDAERLVRARILPSQIREAPPLLPMVDDHKDAHKDLAKRIVGAYGGCHSHPHGGKSAVTDVTSADVHTLVDVYHRVAALRDGGLEVVLHLDQESKHAHVACKRAERGLVTVTPKQAGPVAIRVPQWASSGKIVMQVDGKPVAPVVAGHFARTGRVHAGSKVTMEYDLPERRTRETGLGAEYEIAWRGDDVMGVSPNADFLPFYPTMR